jgi:hypothetical protein
MPGTEIACKLEAQVPSVMLAELDSLMATPTRWPHNVWGLLAPRTLTPAARRWGATEVGVAWLAERGYEIARVDVLRHYRLHVPVMASTLEELGAMAAELDGRRHTPGTPYRGAAAVVTFYDKALALGIRSMELLNRRMDRGQVDDTMLLATANLGARLASSAAMLAVRGGSPLGREDDPWEGARPQIGPRIGHGRMRVIEGVPRHIKDDGPADRAEYSEKAAAEGRVDPFR